MTNLAVPTRSLLHQQAGLLWSCRLSIVSLPSSRSFPAVLQKSSPILPVVFSYSRPSLQFRPLGASPVAFAKTGRKRLCQFSCFSHPSKTTGRRCGARHLRSCKRRKRLCTIRGTARLVVNHEMTRPREHRQNLLCNIDLPKSFRATGIYTKPELPRGQLCLLAFPCWHPYFSAVGLSGLNPENRLSPTLRHNVRCSPSLDWKSRVDEKPSRNSSLGRHFKEVNCSKHCAGLLHHVLACNIDSYQTAKTSPAPLHRILNAKDSFIVGERRSHPPSR